MSTPSEVVDELFGRASSKSPVRALISILDIEKMRHQETTYVVFGSTRLFALYEFVDFFKHVDRIHNSLPGGLDSFIRKLDLLIYSQFWDCASVQRILLNLVGCCSNEEYDYKTYVKKRPETYQVIKGIKEKAKSADLKLAGFLNDNYLNQLRNAFVHSQYFFFDKGISLENHDPKKGYSRPSVQFKEWETISKNTQEFAKCFLTRRIQDLENFQKLSPIQVSIPEFRFKWLDYDSNRGFWNGI